METINILLVDDHTVVREGLSCLLKEQSEFVVAGEAGNGLEAVKKALELKPDVVLMDIRMPKLDGVEAMRRIQAKDPNIKFIVLTTYDTDEYIFESIDIGVSGYLMKDCSRKELFRGLRAVHRGESHIDSAVAARVLKRLGQLSRQEASSPGMISSREIEVMLMMAKGSTNKEIATALSISEGTAKTHVSNIFRKLDAKDRTEAVTKAVQKKIISL